MSMPEERIAEVVMRAFWEIYLYEDVVTKDDDNPFLAESWKYYENYFKQHHLSKWIEFVKEKGWDKDEVFLFGKMIEVFNLFFKYLSRSGRRWEEEERIKVRVEDFKPDNYEVLLEAERLGLGVAFKYLNKSDYFEPNVVDVMDAVRKVKVGWLPFEIILFHSGYEIKGTRVLGDWVVLGSYSRNYFDYDADVEWWLRGLSEDVKETYGIPVEYEGIVEIYRDFLLEEGEKIEGIYVRKDETNGDRLYYAKDDIFEKELRKELEEMLLKRIKEKLLSSRESNEPEVFPLSPSP